MVVQDHYPTDDEAKEAIVKYGRGLYEHGYVVSNDGNITVKVSENEIWCTPTDVSKGAMTPEMMTKLDLDGNILAGAGNPSSEVKMHLRVYKENPDVRAVVHAHPIYATTFSIAGIALDEPTLMEALMQIGCVPVAKYAKPGVEEVPDSIAPFCKDYNAVLLSNHGALTWGNSLSVAYRRMEVLEDYAKVTFNLHLLGKARFLTNEQLAGLDERRRLGGLSPVPMPVGVSQPQNTTDVLPKKD
ncbi:class II aldolase/adducin family protein [Caproiciproducens galactitolivorans]|uniref:Methylthioribulose-1-phosphate dehydratase n=1 Tax=Caproiciproducens galactitolivorans TaxID=642589 RepID=A0A4Z0XZ50_9FIRM|nr:class II aldolase/adducin family protein [Caproiciproducens galactitolivorans]QEY34726.1 class II aldolase/adducin family protein [Caproiciproducens galactitolivorans]TGJ75797.1 methylthioribulose-1-phosphate dehydratase [Caproiciproducens galactitolivorans]